MKSIQLKEFFIVKNPSFLLYLSIQLSNTKVKIKGPKVESTAQKEDKQALICTRYKEILEILILIENKGEATRA